MSVQLSILQLQKNQGATTASQGSNIGKPADGKDNSIFNNIPALLGNSPSVFSENKLDYLTANIEGCESELSEVNDKIEYYESKNDHGVLKKLIMEKLNDKKAELEQKLEQYNSQLKEAKTSKSLNVAS